MVFNMKLFKREKYLTKIRGFVEASDIIKVITGIRRSGKSSLLEIIANELREKGVKEENIIYINLDKRGYKSIKTPDELEKAIDSKVINDGMQYLFIDEIQNVKGFESVINAYREEGNFSIFITGSNSYLLSGELVTKLTGRYIEFEIYPLCFDEYLEMKRFYGKSINSNQLIELNDYLLYGGFPRTLFFDDPIDKRTYAKGLVSEIFEKDIKKKIKIRDPESFELVKKFVINNFGSMMSVSSIEESLGKTGANVSRATIRRYIQALIDAKIIYECDRFDVKSKRVLSGERKYYLADTSLYFSLNTDNRINYGPVLENVVYLYARSLNYEVSVGRIGKLECDFILRDESLDYHYVQVAFSILSSENTENREYRSLESIRDNYTKYILTTDYFIQHRNGIIHRNIMDFMSKKERF